MQNYLYKLKRGGQEVVLTPGTWVVGRTPNAGVYVPDPTVSRRHALIRVARNHVDVLDLGSRNGTFLNAQLIKGARGINPGDRLKFGSLEYEVIGQAVGPGDPYFDDDQETPLPARMIRTEIADRARRPMRNESDDENTVVRRAETIELPRLKTPPPEPPTHDMFRTAPTAATGTGGGIGAGAAGLPAVAPEEAPAPGRVQRVVLALKDLAWGDLIQRAAALHGNLLVERISFTDVRTAAAKPGPGLLLLDADAAGLDSAALVKAWREASGTGTRAALIAATLPDAQGQIEARRIGAQAFVRTGKSAILVVAQIRFHIQLSGMMGEP